MAKEYILKDKYGKDRIFDDDTIYVKATDGELMPFTNGTGNPVIQPLEVTKNGTYTPSEGVDGFGTVNVAVPDIPAVVQPLNITENGTYTAPEGVDGYNPVVVNVAGSSADLRYVTFMNHDGTVEYGKKAVAVGDDCADPIARGIFATPTRESDAQYNYTFYGWATTPNGGADANWNKAIMEDKTVYANFTSTVRYYTITYYDSDGTTVLKTESLAYGSIPSASYVPEKDGYAFTEWVPALSTVTAETSYVAQWQEALDFAYASWEKIAEKSADGTASTLWNVGDTKDITCINASGATQTMTVQIIGFNHDNLADGTGKAGITFACLSDDLPTCVHGTVSTMGGSPYSQTNMNKQLKGDIKNSLPAELQAVLKTVTKTIDRYNNVGSSGHKNPGYLDTELFLFSMAEIGLLTSATGTSIPFLLGSKYSGFTWDTDYKNNVWANVWLRNQYHASNSVNGIYTKPYSSNGNASKWGYVNGDNTITNRIKFGFCV